MNEGHPSHKAAQIGRWMPGRIAANTVREFHVQCECGNEEVVADAGIWWKIRHAEEDFANRTDQHGWQKIAGKWCCPGCVENQQAKGE